jgi:CBS domain containing-hemolysin-like protein
LVTLGDVLAQIFGDIGDEHDVVRPAPSVHSVTLALEGSTTIRELETRYNILLPSEAEFETLAGFMLLHFGHIPQAGERVEYGGRRFTVTLMDRNRIAKVTIERLTETLQNPGA